MPNKIIRSVLAGIILYLLIADFSSDDLKGESCASDDGLTCKFIRKNCDPSYYAFAKLYYCSVLFRHVFTKTCLVLVDILCVVLLLFTLSTVVSSFLFPNLRKISEVLRISDHVLSFCLIPLTNAFPDLVNYHVVLESNSAELVLGQMLGSVLIIFTIIIGSIALIAPFSVKNSRWIIGDYLWMLMISLALLLILSDGQITVRESFAMAVVYGLYVTYATRTDRIIVEDNVVSNNSTDTLNSLDQPLNIEDALQLLACESEPSLAPQHLTLEEDAEHILIYITNQFLLALESSLEIFIPVATENRVSVMKEIWYLIIIPFTLNINYVHLSIADLFPIILLIAITANVIRVYFMNIEVLKHIFVGALGTLMSLVILGKASNYILQLLKNLGLMLNISDYYLGLIIFAFANSVNDIVTNLTIATKIDPILGLNACLGTPPLLVLLGIGFNCLLHTLHHAPLRFDISSELELSLFGIISIIAFYLIYIPLNDWHLDKRLGIIAISWWFIIGVLNFFIH